MNRMPRRLVVGFYQLLAASDQLADFDRMWCERGYERSSARLWRCRDGSYTARVVWRNRAEVLSTITFTVQGVALP